MAIPDFQAKFSSIRNVYLVGFPVTKSDSVGDLIPKGLVYVMKEEAIASASACETLLFTPDLAIAQDPNRLNRIICIEAQFKFFWGCLGGPILNNARSRQVGVIGRIGDQNYLGLRIDIARDWIRQHSHVTFR